MGMYDNETHETANKNLIVSEQFVEIFKNFNVVTQVENMKQLSKRELYLLLTVCLDKFSDEDPVVNFNFQPFKEEVMAIFDIQDDKDVTDTDLISLIDESGDKYIETDYIINNNGDKLPEPLTKEEVDAVLSGKDILPPDPAIEKLAFYKDLRAKYDRGDIEYKDVCKVVVKKYGEEEDFDDYCEKNNLVIYN
jgi:hypothetical protein